MVGRRLRVRASTNVDPYLKNEIWGNGLCGECFVTGRLVAEATEKAIHGNVLIQRFPVEPARADAKLLKLRGRGAEQAWEPCERNSDHATVAESDPHAIRVEVNAGCFSRSMHSMPFR